MTEDEYRARRDVEVSINEALSASIKVSHDEVLKLVVSDMLKKRATCRDESTIAAFDTVLSLYYLTPAELKEATQQLST